MYEWDEAKRLATLEKHGIDFVDAVEIFSGTYPELQGSSEIEERRIAVGPLEGVFIAVVFTPRDDNIRVITARVARQNERKKYNAHVDRRDSAPKVRD